ncbi:glycosyltransferase family 2 protein [Congregibacter sp.]|jgi:glycosyltransferase involved in cell wall biosynthesis|uniref:glycosyltransferase family 2 protein n=1 Tax=Congregibacter sp. TaxID=2744308 RepID=UPI0039E59635
MLVSTIVPVYNGAETLEDTVESLRAQSYKNHEIVLVDDGSSDCSPDLIREFALLDDVTAVFKPNGGVGDARNVGVAHSSGELVAFCDQDDTWESAKLARQVPLFDDESIGLVFSGVRILYEDREVLKTPLIRQPALVDMLVENRISCCTAVVRRSLFDQVNGFDADRVLAGVDDWHLWLRLLQVSQANSVEDLLATHVIHGDNYSLRESVMRDAALLCLEKLGEPSHQPQIDRKLLDDAERRVYEHYGQNLMHQREFRQAADCFINAWYKRPTRLRYLALGACLKLVPESFLLGLQGKRRASARR